MNDLTFLMAVNLIGLSISIYHTLRAFGLFNYNDRKKQDEYELWLKKEGKFRSIMGVIVILVFTIGLIYSLVNFS